MHRAIVFVALGVTLRLGSLVSAALVVNPARPITHEVTIQTIQTALSNGASPAPMFGDPTREAAIKAAIDTVWAQAGIDVNFLPNVVRYNNTFAHQGLGVGVRPISDLGVILSNAAAQGGILHPSPSVINMFFVNVAPGFDAKASNWANGVGNVGLNGIAVFVGSSVSAEHAGHWMAHEIGHNLGLLHAPSGSQNLMTSSRNTELLSNEQVNAMLSTQEVENAIALIPAGGTGFPRPLSSQMPGDYDRSGLVDASDYAVWRNSLTSRTNLLADGNKNGIIDGADFGVWRSNFGRGVVTQQVVAGDYNLNGEVDAGDYSVWRSTRGSTTDLSADGNGNGVVDDGDFTMWRSNFGGGAAAAVFEAGGEPQFAGDQGSPEPSSVTLVVSGLAYFLARHRRRRRK